MPIDQNLFAKLQNKDEHHCLFANGDTLEAEFFLQGMEIRLSVTDQEMDAIIAAQEQLHKNSNNEIRLSRSEIIAAESLYLPFMQAHNHEIMHLAQILCLPALQVAWASRVSYFSHEAAIMLRYFEYGGSYELGEHKKIIDALLDSEFAPLTDQNGSAQKIAEAYDFYDDWWRNELEGISLFHIIEGMAHYASKQLADNETRDHLNLERNTDYTTAYNHFQKSIEPDELPERWSYLLFVFVCYFACQYFDTVGQKDGLTPVRRFLWLCQRVPEYLASLKKLRERYCRYSSEELLNLCRWGIEIADLKNASNEQIGSLFAFFELLELIEEECVSGASRPVIKTDRLSDFQQESTVLNIDWEDKFTLARFMVFPAQFVDVRILYDNVSDSKVGDNSYTYGEQATFWRFIANCKNLFDGRDEIPCCEKHGMVVPSQSMLMCDEEGGFAYYLQALTGRSATDLFRTWRPQ